MNAEVKPKGNAAARYAFLFVLGLVVGIIATVMTMRAIDARADHYPESVMTVMDAHFDALDGNVQANRCVDTDILPHLQTMRMMANDIETAFTTLRDDKKFAGHASDLRAELDRALFNPSVTCADAAKQLKTIGGKCKACHQEYRN